MRPVFIKAFVLISYIGMLVVNYLANALPINGMTTGAVSNSYPNLFAPASITFSIWGVIYLLLGFFVFYLFGAFGKIEREKLVKQISVLLIISSIANIIWIFLWHYDLIGVSVLFMLIILGCLILILELIVKEKRSLTSKEYFFLRLPFSIYFGWITVATIANITTFFVSVNWGGFGLADTSWMIIILLVGLFIGGLVAIRNRDVAYILVLIWAYCGILIKHISESGFNLEFVSVISIVIFCITVFILILGFMLKKYFTVSSSRF
jgi:hypothetical protein